MDDKISTKGCKQEKIYYEKCVDGDRVYGVIITSGTYNKDKSIDSVKNNYDIEKFLEDFSE